MIGWLRRRLERIALEAAQEIEDQVALDLELGMAIRRVRDRLPADWVVTVAVRRDAPVSTVALFKRGPGDHAVLVRSQRRATATEALDAIAETLT